MSSFRSCFFVIIIFIWLVVSLGFFCFPFCLAPASLADLFSWFVLARTGLMVLTKLFSSSSKKSSDKKKHHKPSTSSTSDLSDLQLHDSQYPPPLARAASSDRHNDYSLDVASRHHHPNPDHHRSPQPSTTTTTTTSSNNNNNSTKSASSLRLGVPRKSPSKASPKSQREPEHKSRRVASTPSGSPTKHKPKNSSSRFAYDRDSHPLNLPPDELRRLSAMAAARDDSRSSMDIEQPDAAAATNTAVSPSAFSTLTQQDSRASSPGTQSNGVHSDTAERSPTPPPHNVPSSTPQPAPPVVDAEACKLAGNKFFKAGDYQKAISEYTKGKCLLSVLFSFFPPQISWVNSIYAMA